MHHKYEAFLVFAIDMICQPNDTKSMLSNFVQQKHSFVCLVLGWIASIVMFNDLRPYIFAYIMLWLLFLLWPMIVMWHLSSEGVVRKPSALCNKIVCTLDLVCGQSLCLACSFIWGLLCPVFADDWNVTSQRWRDVSFWPSTVYKYPCMCTFLGQKGSYVPQSSFYEA
jgi:hypothetical protein